MAAHSSVFRFLPNPSIPPSLKPQNSSNLSSSNHQNLIFFKPHFSPKLISQTNGVNGRIQSIHKVDQVENLDTARKEVGRKKLAVFVSGGGSNFKSIHQGCVGGGVNGEVAVVVTNKPDCGGAEYARHKGIPVIVFPQTSNVPTGISPDCLVTALRNFEVNFVILAGYLKLLPVELVRAYPKSILNIHPALLPAFGGKGYYGMKVHKAVIASGARYSGPTVHFVDEHYDTGRILAQSVVPVLANDTPEELAARVLFEEHQLYVEVTSALCEDRIVWREDGVPLIQSKENPQQYY